MIRTQKGIREKYCTKCEAWRAVAEFGNRKDLPDGKQCHCKACVKIANAMYAARKVESIWHSSEEWLDKFAKEYNKKHPIDKCFPNRVSSPLRSSWGMTIKRIGMPIQ